MEKEVKFTVKLNGQDISLKVVRPTHKQRTESDRVKNTIFRQSVQGGAYLMTELDNELKKRGFWDEEKEIKIKELQNFIRNAVKKLNEGGFDINEAKNLAIEISGKRVELMSLSTVRADFIDKTAEGQANNAAFDYLVSQCAVYNDTGKTYFSSYDEYIIRKGDEDAVECASKLYELLYNRINDDTLMNLPENQFLREFKFVDNKMRLINEDGKLVDDQGRLIDEEGNWINDQGQKIDIYGNILGEDGKPIIKRKPFTKNGVEIKVETLEEKTEEINNDNTVALEQIKSS
jgi:hypothetical protein